MNIIIYGTPTCRWCLAAKELCQRNGVDYEYRDLTYMKPVDANNVMHFSGMKSVPIIYNGVTLVGGYEDLRKLFKEGNTV